MARFVRLPGYNGDAIARDLHPLPLDKAFLIKEPRALLPLSGAKSTPRLCRPEYKLARARQRQYDLQIGGKNYGSNKTKSKRRQDVGKKETRSVGEDKVFVVNNRKKENGHGIKAGGEEEDWYHNFAIDQIGGGEEDLSIEANRQLAFIKIEAGGQKDKLVQIQLVQKEYDVEPQTRRKAFVQPFVI